MPSFASIAAKTLDGLQYAVLVTAAVTLVLAPVSLLVTGDLVFAKYGLFFLGFLTVAIGSWKLRPPARNRSPSRFHVPNTRAERGFGAVVNRVPPAAWYLDEDDRLSDGARLVVAGVALLVASYLLELVFHVGVDPALR